MLALAERLAHHFELQEIARALQLRHRDADPAVVNEMPVAQSGFSSICWSQRRFSSGSVCLFGKRGNGFELPYS